MSENIYNRAKFYVDKVLYIFDGLDKCREQLRKRSCDYYSKYKFNADSFCYRGNRFKPYRMLAKRNEYSSVKDDVRYWINDTGTNSMKGFDRPFMKIEQYSEDLDFMLSTLFDDTELFDYYVGSFLYTSGFRGYVEMNISHNTLNAFVRHVDDMYICREKLWS